MSNVVDSFGKESALLVNSFNGALVTEGAREKIENYHTAYFPSRDNDGEYDSNLYNNGISMPTAPVNKNEFVYFPNDKDGNAWVSDTLTNDKFFVDMSSIKFRNCSHISIHVNVSNFDNSLTGIGPKAYCVLLGFNDRPGPNLPPTHPYFLDTDGTDFYNLGCLVKEAFVETKSNETATGGMYLTGVASNVSSAAGETNPIGGPNANGIRIWKLGSAVVPIQFKYYTLGVANFGANTGGIFISRCQFSGVS